MRTLVVIPYFAPAWCYGGPALVVHDACRGLAGLGEGVRVLTTSANGTGELEVPLGRPVDVDGVETYYYPRQFPRHYFWSRGLVRAVHEQAAEFDIIHAHTCFVPLGVAVRQAARRAGKPYVVTCHGSLDPVVLRQKRLKKALYWRLLERRNMQQAAALIALTEEERGQILAVVPGQRVEVIPNGVAGIGQADVPARSELAQIDARLVSRPYVLFLSRLVWKKGLDMLIPAFARLAERFPEWNVVLAGPDEGGYASVVEHMLREHGLQERFICTGLVAGERKLALLGNADVFCLPSYSEGLPTCVVEALMCGRPVVITRNCYMPEVEAVGAGWVVETTLEGVTGGLQAAMAASAGERTERGVRGHAHAVASYSRDSVALRTRRFYQSVVGEQVGCVAAEVSR